MREEMSRDQKIQADLFEKTMNKKWDEVVKIYKEYPFVHIAKLTKAENTSFHIAISNSRGLDYGYLHDMMKTMEKEKSLHEVLSMKNMRGDTPLHLAAAVGSTSVCKSIHEIDRDLIKVRNARGETPLFVAANHGKLQAFLCLHEHFNIKSDEFLFRRHDGNTILHAAIFGDHYVLAYQISTYYGYDLVHVRNADGDTPLHVLAKKPNVFKSCETNEFIDSIIYHCVFVDEIMEQEYNQRETQNSSSQEQMINYPENYATCVEILFRLRTTIYNLSLALFEKCMKGNSRSTSTDEENQQHTPKEPQIKESKAKSEDHAFVPPNYTTCVSLFKFVVKVILIVVGAGYGKIKKIKKKKKRHSQAEQIMNKLIELEPSYKYDSNGLQPLQKPDLEAFKLPFEPPQAENEYENEKDEDEKDKKEKSGKLVSPKKETPLLVAAKMGILEIVKKIVSKYPEAIEDEDEDGKNALMIAAENRQTIVFDYLTKKEFPDSVFLHMDNNGNDIIHLAAMLGKNQQPWRIPGAALQMHWELRWYEYVKNSIPIMSISHYNNKGETPRMIFRKTHEDLMKEGHEWLIKTSESCSLVAALIAGVAFATAATVPGGLDQSSGHPVLKDDKAFDIFSITSLVALCLSITALVYFLAIITSRFEESAFRTNLPRKLLMGLTCLFSSIAAMLLSFCAGHTFIVTKKLRFAAVPIYALAGVPISLFAIAQLPLYFDLISSAAKTLPLRGHKPFHY